MVAASSNTLLTTQRHRQLPVQRCGISDRPEKDGLPRSKDESKQPTSAVRNVGDLAYSPSNARAHSHRRRSSHQRSLRSRFPLRSNYRKLFRRRRRTHRIALRPTIGSHRRRCPPEVRASHRGRFGRMMVFSYRFCSTPLSWWITIRTFRIMGSVAQTHQDSS